MTGATEWPPSRIEMLRELAEKGLSASGIAKAMSAALGIPVTRNAIIGKCHRTGIELQSGLTGGEPRKPKVVKPKAIKEPPQEKVETMPTQIALPFSNRVALMDLREGLCRFPIGDPGRDDFAFCGAEKPIDGKPYCAAHMALCYVPSRPRKDASTYSYASAKNLRVPYV
jgi:GcrA cell cycle regulator